MNGQHLFSKYLKFIKNVPFWDFFSELSIQKKNRSYLSRRSRRRMKMWTSEGERIGVCWHNSLPSVERGLPRWCLLWQTFGTVAFGIREPIGQLPHYNSIKNHELVVAQRMTNFFRRLHSVWNITQTVSFYNIAIVKWDNFRGFSNNVDVSILLGHDRLVH